VTGTERLGERSAGLGMKMHLQPGLQELVDAACIDQGEVAVLSPFSSHCGDDLCRIGGLHVNQRQRDEE
jgi:hypothetical protein